MRSSRRQWFQQTATLGLASYWVANGYSQEETKPESKLIVRQEQPFNAEPSLADLVKQHITPVELFYVRSHGDVPKIDEAAFKVKITGLVNRELEFSVAELKDKFDTHKIAATLTCAGNRRQELSSIKKVGGVQWDAGAIGNAEWMGPMLFDVLKAAELKPDAKHVWLEGLDPIKEKDGSEAPFGGSISLEKALVNKGENTPSLLAHTMNGQPLTAAHGAPLRLVVPGFIGARSVKWLGKIIVSDKPSTNHYLAEAYKIIQTDDKDEIAKAEPIYNIPLNAAIGMTNGTQLKAGKQLIRGYALPQGELLHIELSTNNGRTWREIRGSERNTTGVNQFNWWLWESVAEILPGKQTLIVRAKGYRRVAGDFQEITTPEQGEWNLKGYMFNAWHRVRVEGV